MTQQSLIKTASNINCVNKQLAHQSYQTLLNHFTQPYTDYDNKENQRLIKRIEKIGGKHAHNLLEIINKPVTYEDINEQIYKAVIEAGIDEKEFYEAKEFFVKTKPIFHQYFDLKQGEKLDYVIDFCSGNGLNGFFWLLQQATDKVLFVDNKENSNFRKLETFLNLDKHDYYLSPEFIQISKTKTIVTAIHACGDLTDTLIDSAIKITKPYAVVPCCYSENNTVVDKKFLEYFTTPCECIDIARILKTQNSNYKALVREISKYVTDKNRILIGLPDKNEES